MKVVATTYEHMERIDPKEAVQVRLKLENTGMVCSFLDEKERPIAIAGVTPMWGKVAEAFGFVDRSLTPFEARWFSRWCRNWLAESTFDRIQAPVAVHFVEGANFAELCGLTLEGELKGYGPDGSNYYMYAWVRE